jgi:hypothetical protein
MCTSLIAFTIRVVLLLCPENTMLMEPLQNPPNNAKIIFQTTTNENKGNSSPCK